MSTCFTCGAPTEGAEFCSASCFYTGEEERGAPLATESVALENDEE